MLVAGKTRVVAPKDDGNIPRLELRAAVLGARLTDSILAALHSYDIKQVYCWSDSKTVLHG